jgi:hypothetical protein
MIPTFSSILSTIKNIEDSFDIVKEKLLNNPSEASDKLAEVLGELSLILEFIEKETVRYLEIIFLSDKSNLIPCRSALLSLESGYATIKGYEARGHCHKIKNIYEKFLNHWFSKVLDAHEAEDLKRLFDRMNSADSGMIEAIREITTWLRDESEAILLMIDADQLDLANQRIKDARLPVQIIRRNIVDGLAQMKLLQASFIASSQSI